MDYSLICSQMTWSYSRIKSFSDCRYGFFLKYIAMVDKGRQFFSEYGSIVHELLAAYYSGGMQRQDLIPEFISRFCNEVPSRLAPSPKIAADYFEQAIAFLKNPPQFPGAVCGVERHFSFEVGGFPFTGFVDLITNGPSGLRIVDHKSRALKQRSKRAKPTKTDLELDSYLRQLYLYSIPVAEAFGETPKELVFNCYRSGELICESFSEEKFSEAKEWALNSILDIISCKNWSPNLDFFRCRYLCDVHDECEYYALHGGGAS